MIYRSNLEAPDFTAAFPYLHVRPMPHSYGHSVPSDWSDKAPDDPIFDTPDSITWKLYKNCGMLTHDEAAILYNISGRTVKGGLWLDIGSHTGWSTAHIAGSSIGIDPMYGVPEFLARAKDNTVRADKSPVLLNQFLNSTSRAFFADIPQECHFAGIMIDGDHSEGEPQHDSIEALKHLGENGVIVFHDFIGRPVREGVQYLMSQGLKSRVYLTPHMMAVCWRGNFEPPDHVHDPRLGFLRSKVPDFDLGRCA